MEHVLAAADAKEQQLGLRQTDSVLGSHSVTHWLIAQSTNQSGRQINSQLQAGK